MNVTDDIPEEVINTDDPRMLQMELAYPGLGVADFVLAVSTPMVSATCDSRHVSELS